MNHEGGDFDPFDPDPYGLSEALKKGRTQIERTYPLEAVLRLLPWREVSLDEEDLARLWAYLELLRHSVFSDVYVSALIQECRHKILYPLIRPDVSGVVRMLRQIQDLSPEVLRRAQMDPSPYAYTPKRVFVFQTLRELYRPLIERAYNLLPPVPKNPEEEVEFTVDELKAHRVIPEQADVDPELDGADSSDRVNLVAVHNFIVNAAFTLRRQADFSHSIKVFSWKDSQRFTLSFSFIESVKAASEDTKIIGHYRYGIQLKDQEIPSHNALVPFNGEISVEPVQGSAQKRYTYTLSFPNSSNAVGKL
jgi:hypothetical protein